MQTASIGKSSYQPDYQIASKTTTNGCLAILWVRETVNLDACMALIAQQPGVESVRVTRDNPCLLIVDYDRNQTTALLVQQFVRRLGVQVKLIGC